MIEVRVPKEIREYEEKWICGLTKRQLGCAILALLINVPLFLAVRNYIGDELAGWLIIFTSLPFILTGYYKHNGMSFEKWLICMYRFISIPQKRIYQTENIYAWIKEEYEKEDFNGDFKETNKIKRRKNQKAEKK